MAVLVSGCSGAWVRCAGRAQDVGGCRLALVVDPALPLGADLRRRRPGQQADHDEGDQAADQPGENRLVGVDVAVDSMVPRVSTVPVAMLTSAPAMVPRFQIIPPMMATSRPPTRMS